MLNQNTVGHINMPISKTWKFHYKNTPTNKLWYFKQLKKNTQLKNTRPDVGGLWLAVDPILAKHSDLQANSCDLVITNQVMWLDHHKPSHVTQNFDDDDDDDDSNNSDDDDDKENPKVFQTQIMFSIFIHHLYVFFFGYNVLNQLQLSQFSRGKNTLQLHKSPPAKLSPS